MKYRPEIDGLRAVAVLPVVLFHAGFEVLSGGFVGVDVFFVISGFLITSIILAEMEQDRFSIINFYERRARRILPALFLVMIVSLPFAWFWLIPSDMKDFSKSLIAVSSFVSNILFWSESGYWGAVNEFKPLLHTWSLSVEEQYYLVFPLFLIMMWRFRKRWILASFSLIAICSLALAQWGAYKLPTATFFMLPARAWELAIGAVIAFYFLYREKDVRKLFSYQLMDEVLSLLGLLMILYAVFVFDKTVPFPSLYALIPTVGAGLIILFSSNTIVGKLLSTKLMVGVGLISYSAYLWHQPLFAFARHKSLTGPSGFLFIILAIFSFLLAYISWKYIEAPFRDKKKINKTVVFKFSGVGTLFFIFVGVVGYMSNGFANRTMASGNTLSSLDKKIQPNYGLSKNCGTVVEQSSNCSTSDEPEILIWGDSFAMHLIPGILSSNPKAKIIQMTKSNCGPFFQVAPVFKPNNNIAWAKGCLRFAHDVYSWLKENKTVKTVVLSSPFDQYFFSSSELLYQNGDLKKSSHKLLINAFATTLTELKSMGVVPIIFSPTPTNGQDLGRCLVHAQRDGIPLDVCNYNRSNISQKRKETYRFLDNFKTTNKVVYLDDYMCNDLVCKTHTGLTFFYRDNRHLSIEGSSYLGKHYDFYSLISQP